VKICAMDGAEAEAARVDELERLRARVADLERELVEVQERANAAVASAEERAYWLDRWHLDLNAVMRRPGAQRLRSAVHSMRGVARRARKAKRRFLG
jgi:hypothetical protein